MAMLKNTKTSGSVTSAGTNTGTTAASSSSASSAAAGTTPVIAIACGPTVTTWDLAKSATSQTTNFFDAKALVGKGTGVDQFHPHGDHDHVVDIAWNHNGQVIASCSDSNSERSMPNIVLTHHASQTKLESLSNFHMTTSSTNSKNMTSANYDTSPTSSISFGGRNAKSRYLCVSDRGGAASVWDMKKLSRVRCFRMRNYGGSHGNENGMSSSNSRGGGSIGSNNKSGDEYTRPSCAKSCMDPTDTHVVALHGDSILHPTKQITLELFHLKTGGRMGLLQTTEGLYGGGADSFAFSNWNHERLLVGGRDGSLLLWDVSLATGGGRNAHHGPTSVLERRHTGSVTDVAFSPSTGSGKELLASCSMDGTVAFHDLDSNTTIQTIEPTQRHHQKSHHLGFPNKSAKGLTSFAFHHDGYTWACGTEDGLVYTYDLRQSTAGPLCIMDVNTDGTNAVSSIQFMQTSVSSSSSKTPKSAMKTQARTSIVKENGADAKMPSSVSTETATFDPSSLSTSRTSLGKKNLSSSLTNVVPSKRTTSNMEKISEDSTTLSSSASYNYLGSPPATNIVKDLFHNNSTNTVGSVSPKNSSIKVATAASPNRKDLSVSFDERVKIGLSSSKQTRKVNGHTPEVDSDDLGDEMIKDFDKMYERIKSGALHTASNALNTTDVDGADADIDASTDATDDGDSNAENEPTSTQRYVSSGTPYLRKAVEVDGNDERLVLSKAQVEEMIEDAIDAVRDEIQESMQALHCSFLRELQKQANDVSSALQRHQHKFQQLQAENVSLKEENERLKKFF